MLTWAADSDVTGTMARSKLEMLEPMESNELRLARQHLADVERDLLAPDAELKADEGLLLLEELAADGAEHAVASNLGRRSMAVFTGQIRAALEAADIPEEALKRLLRLSQVLGDSAFAEGTDVTVLTGEVAERYVNALLEGYTESERAAAMESALQRLNR